jgi:prevent-host-death family protein
MKQVAISEFKAKCLSLLEQVQKTKQPISVTRFGKPIAEIVPASPEARPGDWDWLHEGHDEDYGRHCLSRQ